MTFFCSVCCERVQGKAETLVGWRCDGRCEAPRNHMICLLCEPHPESLLQTALCEKSGEEEEFKQLDDAVRRISKQLGGAAQEHKQQENEAQQSKQLDDAAQPELPQPIVAEAVITPHEPKISPPKKRNKKRRKQTPANSAGNSPTEIQRGKRAAK